MGEPGDEIQVEEGTVELPPRAQAEALAAPIHRPIDHAPPPAAAPSAAPPRVSPRGSAWPILKGIALGVVIVSVGLAIFIGVRESQPRRAVTPPAAHP